MEDISIVWTFGNSEIQFQYFKLSLITTLKKNNINNIIYTVIIEDHSLKDDVEDFLKRWVKKYKIIIFNDLISYERIRNNKYIYHIFSPFLTDTNTTIFLDNDMIVNCNFHDLLLDNLEKLNKNLILGREGGNTKLKNTTKLNKIKIYKRNLLFKNKCHFLGSLFVYNNSLYKKRYKDINNLVKLLNKIYYKMDDFKKRGTNLYFRNELIDEAFFFLTEQKLIDKLSYKYNITSYIDQKEIKKALLEGEWIYHITKSKSFREEFLLGDVEKVSNKEFIYEKMFQNILENFNEINKKNHDEISSFIAKEISEIVWDVISNAKSQDTKNDEK